MPIDNRILYLFLLTFYKIINHLVPIIDESLIPPKLQSMTRLAACEGLRSIGVGFRFELGSFGVNAYNQLPPPILQSSSLLSFKSSLREHLLLQ